MALPSTDRTPNQSTYSPQAMDNWSFDNDFKQHAREILGLDVGASTLRRLGALTSVPVFGQAKIAVTATAVQLGSNALSNGVIIYAKSSNSAPISVGGASVSNTVDGTGNGVILEAGAALSAAVTNTNVLYINGTAGDIVSFIGS